MTPTVKTKEDLFEAILRQAVIDSVYRDAEKIAAMELPNEAEIASSSRAKKTRRLCLREDRKERFKRKTAPRLRRALLAAAAVVIILSSSMMAYPAVRAAVADVFIEWFDQFTKFTGLGSQPNTVRQWEATFIPEGYVETDRIESEQFTVINYENGEGALLTFLYQPDSEVIAMDNEDRLYREEFVGEVCYRIFESQDKRKSTSIYWNSEDYMFEVSGYIDVASLLEIALSVK